MSCFLTDSELAQTPLQGGYTVAYLRESVCFGREDDLLEAIGWALKRLQGLPSFHAARQLLSEKPSRAHHRIVGRS